MRRTLPRLVVVLTFLIILVVGLCVYDDYGISTDEAQERNSSIVSYRYLNQVLFDREPFPGMESNVDIHTYTDRYYGIALQLPLVFAEDMYRQATGAAMPAETIYQMRHLYTFLFYYFALFCFYFLLKHLFESRPLALCGVLMVFLFGRFFAHSFYNIKDMLFASMMVITLCCAERVLATGRKPLWCVLFAVSGAFLVSSRLAGAIAIVLLMVAMLVQDIVMLVESKRNSTPKKPIFRVLLPYLFICLAYPVWVLITPASWSNPIAFSFGYLSTFSNYSQWHGYVSFMGKLYEGIYAPRGYFVVWIAITVPIGYLVLSVIGAGALVLNVISDYKAKKLQPNTKPLMLWMMLGIIVFTLGYQIIKRPTLYNGWRHAYYLYPMMIALAVYALSLLTCKKGKQTVIIYCVVGLMLLYQGYRIAASHPHEYAMFNEVGRHFAIGFERDYWHLTNSELLAWIRDYDPDFDGKDYFFYIYAEGEPEAEIAARLNKMDGKPSYILLNYSRIPNTNLIEVDGYKEVHSIWLDGVKLSAVLERE